MKTKILYTGLGACLSLALVLTSVTFANQVSDEIRACVSGANGSVRIISPLDPIGCKKNETLTTWNKEGKEGVAGPQGEPGPVGPEGPQGEPGVVDVSLLAALEARIAALEAGGGGGGGGVTVDAATIRSNSSSPDATSLLVEEDSSKSDKYAVHVFDVEIDEDSSDLSLKDAYVWVTITNPEGGVVTTVGDVVDDIDLVIGGKAVTGEPISYGTNEDEVGHLIAGGESNRVGYRFEFGGLTLQNDVRYQAEVLMSFEGTDGGSQYTPRVTVATDVVGVEWELEGVAGTNVLTGVDASETHRLATIIPVISDVASTVARNESGSAGVISFEFTVEAQDDDLQLSMDDILLKIIGTNPAIANTPVLTHISGDAMFAGGEWEIQDGDEATFVLDVTFISEDSGDNGVYRVNLESILGVEIDETSPGLSLAYSS